MHIAFPPLPERPSAARLPPLPEKKRSSSTADGPFSSLCKNLLRDERRLQETVRRLSGNRVLEPEKLLELQALVYASMQRVEVVSRCVQSVQSTLNHLRQGQ